MRMIHTYKLTELVSFLIWQFFIVIYHVSLPTLAFLTGLSDPYERGYSASKVRLVCIQHLKRQRF